MDFFMNTKKTQQNASAQELMENTTRTISPDLNINSANGEKKFLIYQYFIPKSKERLEEMQYCMKKNFQNTAIQKIYLLNERIYTREELGLQQWKQNIIDERIEQISIGTRMKFCDIFDFVEKKRLLGFIIFINSDIFFDETLKLLNKSDLHLHKSLVSLLRYEYRSYIKDLKDCRLFGPRGDSQDTWMYHSDYNIAPTHRKAFDFYFGQPGCDNKLLYLFKTLGFELYNVPHILRSYHFHNENGRNYTLNNVKPPHLIIMPYKKEGYGNGLQNSYTDTLRFTMKKDNNDLNTYIKTKLQKNEHFIIPRIAGIENEVAFIGNMVIKNNGLLEKNAADYLKKAVHTMKNNAGIKLTNMNSIIKYSILYLQSFDKCDVYTDWEPYGNVYKWIKSSHKFISNEYASTKQPIWARTLDIFEYIYNDPWTQCLSGKRILIISSFAETIEKNITNSPNIYNIDLFPSCTFVYLKPPQTNGENESRDFFDELSDFCTKISEIKDSFDIALVSCGGYGNLVCNHIYDCNKSAIYVGGVLQMYFGILGSRWKREKPDILKMYYNDSWHSPGVNERPKGFENIEGSCYW
jgi:hypothetical protein